ncbi:non-ribosomal peptide synthetase [Actinokineospora bangkokensis]|uniref:Non-ribosomal peptide synthetase n=1 Tax=Actinokineospora bangkokensis TaxID=1193682 RepID=A0A1Q9LM01_9PSEU|nr:non-ribosomal peptide synthetase [Actinokineospora bangkokensis]OLR93067.1 non-ribosomal peptide synthetase [Actinokineospora bangkokensis]
MDSARVVSFAQERLWFLDQLQPGAPDYLLTLAVRVRGDLDVAALTAALQGVVDRHDALRTRFAAVDGGPVAVVDERVEVVLHRSDDPDPLATEVRRPVDLAAGPPLRATLARVADDEHLLIVVVHHIAFDGTSWGIFAAELAEGYRAHTTGTAPDLAPAPSYVEHARWQRERFSGARSEKQLAYWRTTLDGVPPLDLPTDRPRPATWDGTGGVVHFDLPAEVLAAADRFARSRRCTRYMVLLAALQAVLGRAAGQDDFAVGTPVAGRLKAGADKVIGLFVNSVALRADLSGAPTFDELLGRVRAAALGAFTHAEAPFERVVDALSPERDLSRNPVYQVSFSLLEVGAPTTLPGLATEFVEPPATGTPTDLFFDVNVRRDGTVNARLHFAAALFDHDRAARIADGFVRVLAAAVERPGASAKSLAAVVDLLPEGQRDKLLGEWNDTTTALPDRTIVDLVAAQALFSPGATAITSAAGDTTYAELDAGANRLAHHLAALGAGPGELVAVLLDRGPHLLTSLLAVLKTGAAYVPVDPDFPAGRVALMVEDSGARLVLTETGLGDRVPATTARVLLVDAERAAIAARPATPPAHRPTGHDPAYAIYTSGSTGTPKGVVVDHAALTAFATAATARPGMTAADRVVALTTISFDPSVLELYSPLLVGATVVLADAEQARDPERMIALVERERPTVLQATPVTLRMLADNGWLPRAGMRVLSGGEKLPAELVRRLAAGGATVWDLYGPTEATVWASAARMRADGTVADWSALANYTIHLLDADLQLVPVGSVGELYIGGRGVATGYRGRPAATADRYVPDPYATAPGGRLYRTGDLARRRQDGSVEILGRADRQVKIRGHRMEPGEIEAALLRHGTVRAAVVRPTPTPTGEPQLTAYVVPRGEVVVDELRASLLDRLPDYMVPAAFVVLDAFPVTPNGKVDHARLPLPRARAAEVATAPATPEERAVAQVWQEVLGVERVGAHDDFFELGGHSLLATRVAVRLRARLGVDVPVRGLFDHSTVAALAAALGGYPAVAERSAVPALTARRRAGVR